MHGTTLVRLPAKKVYGVVCRRLGKIKALFLNLSIPILAFEARNSTGLAGAPYGEHGRLRDGAGSRGGLPAPFGQSHFSAERLVCHRTGASAFGVNLIVLEVACEQCRPRDQLDCSKGKTNKVSIKG